MSEPFIGELTMWAGTTGIPSGWMECDGTQLQTNDYLDLYLAIGAAYGGDGATTFNLPDLRGRVPIGLGSDSYGNTYAIGNSGGAESVTLTMANLPAHSHAFAATTAAGSAQTPASNLLAAAQNGVDLYRTNAPTVAMATGTIGNSPGGAAHENRQPFMAITYIIAYTGINPTFSA